MNTRQNVIRVSKPELKIIYVCEMAGQISDGQWENAEPHNHWEPWCQAKVEVATPVGKNFWAPKNTYGFNYGELLDIVGERIRTKVALWKLLGDKFADEVLFEDHWRVPDGVAEYDAIVAGKYGNAEYSANRKAQLDEMETKYGFTREVLAKAESGEVYSDKQLRHDCWQLMMECRERILE